jgi:pimeloyl-ACP methyl ester carboxylesterase
VTAARPARLRRVALALLALVSLPFLVLLALHVHNRRAVSEFRARPDASGRIVDVGGHAVFVRERGRGEPTVIFEAGYGSSIEWWAVQDRVAEQTHTISYERAGYGWSAPRQGKRDAATIGRERDRVLAALGAKPPFVWVGESVGALYVQEVMRRRARDTLGALLVDPVTTGHARFEQELSRAFYQNLINLAPRIQGARAAAALGLQRALRALPFDSGGPALRRALVELYAADETYRALLAEHAGIEASAAQTLAAGPLPDVPLVVLHHAPDAFVEELQFFQMSFDEATKVESLFRALVDETVAASPRGRVVTAKRGTRYLHMDEPDLIVRLISELIEEARAD